MRLTRRFWGNYIALQPFLALPYQAVLAHGHSYLHPVLPSHPQQVSGFKGLRFLAAEDNEINAEILGELLEIEGAYCEIVENGK